MTKMVNRIGGVVRRAAIIGNGVAGAENQCFGLVRALGLSHRQTLYRVNRPRGGIHELLHWLPVSLHRRLDHLKMKINDTCFTSSAKGPSDVLNADAVQIAETACETFEKDGPLLVVASGRDTISTASSIKRLAAEHVFVIQIQHPRLWLNRFDMVITPRHDYYRLTDQGHECSPWSLRKWITRRQRPERNVVLTLGALHHVDSASLQSAASAWHDQFVSLPKPLLVVNIGGPTRHCRYGADLAHQLAASLNNVLSQVGTLRVSFSRRTPKEVCDILVRKVGNHPKVYIWDGKGPNPHMGHLAWADAFVVTADSVSMLSEACSTGKPVYVVGADRCLGKFVDFQNSLRERGMVQKFTGTEDICESWSYQPLRDTAEAAERVIDAVAERGWRFIPQDPLQSTLFTENSF